MASVGTVGSSTSKSTTAAFFNPRRKPTSGTGMSTSTDRTEEAARPSRPTEPTSLQTDTVQPGVAENQTFNLPWPVFAKYYDAKGVSENGKNFIVKCKLCMPKNKILSTSKISASNLKKHIVAVHGSTVTELENRLCAATAASKKRDFEDVDDPLPKRQQTTIVDAFKGSSSVSQASLDIMITEFVVAGNHPFATVEQPKFKTLINKGFPGRNLLTRKTLTNRITTESTKMKAALKEKLTSIAIKHVCVTTDCWSVYKRSYIGMTVHWIDVETLTRRSAALACRRIKGKHTYDALSEIMCDILKDYGITNKVTRVVTDNGSNFVKAFRLFGREEVVGHQYGAEELAEEENVGTGLNEETDEGDESEPVEIEEILNDVPQNPQFSLPPHHRCASHTLNLVATKDAEKALQNNNYKRQFHQTFGRCQAIWNKQNQATLTADHIQENLNVYLLVPNATRWNSTYKAVECLRGFLESKEEELNRVCDLANLPRFQKKDLEFMTEYCKVMDPIARALDTLQGDKLMCMGYLLPTVTWLTRVLRKLVTEELKYCAPLAVACADAIDHRFAAMKVEEGLILAAVVHPKFKLRWIRDATFKDEAREILLSELETTESPALARTADEDDEDFLFSDEVPEIAESEAQQYLAAPATSDLACLQSMPRIKNLFVKYNSALPSSASVERLFSVAGDICSKKRGRLTDANFENALIYKSNMKMQ